MLQFMDGFQLYGTGSAGAARLLNGVYAENGFCTLAADPDPTAGGKQVISFSTTTGGTAVLRRVLSAAQTTIGVALRGWMGILPASNGDGFRYASFRDINNVEHGYIGVDPSGYIVAFRSDSGGAVQLGISSGPVIVANAWQHVETKWVCDAAAGSIEVRVEGSTVLTLSAIRTTTNVTGAVATCSNVAVNFRTGGETGGLTGYAKDLIIWDNSGTVNNDFFGTCSVYTLVPDSDVSLGWTPSTGTVGWDLINDSPPGDDAAYISASSAGLISTFTLTDLPSYITDVKACMTMVRGRKVDSGDGNLTVGVISSGTEADGTDRPLTTAYTYWTDTRDLDPHTSDIWTVAAVDAVEIKVDRTV